MWLPSRLIPTLDPPPAAAAAAAVDDEVLGVNCRVLAAVVLLLTAVGVPGTEDSEGLRGGIFFTSV